MRLQQPQSRRRASFAPRQKLRLWTLVASLSFVIIAVQMARDPAMWEFVTSGGKPPADNRKPLNFQVEFEDDDPLRPDEFRSRRPASSPAAIAEAPEDGTAQAEPAEATPHNGQSDEAKPASSPVGIDRSLLEEVRDNTLGVRSDEAPAYFEMLERARNRSPVQLEAASFGPVEFGVLMTDSSSFRGKIVTIEGLVRRIVPFEASKNDAGFTRLYEAWMFTEDSGNNPFCIVFSSPPDDGIPLEDLAEKPVRVRATGYFLKLQGYASEGGTHVAPLVLAQQLKVLSASKPDGPAPPPPNLGRWVLVVTLSLAGLLALILWRFRAGDAGFQRRYRMKKLAESNPDSLNALPTADPMETLRQISEEHRQSESQS